MSRTRKDMPKKVRNFHAVNAHFRRSGPMVDRKKEQDKYATRASRAIEDYKHNEEHEDIEEYEIFKDTFFIGWYNSFIRD